MSETRVISIRTGECYDENGNWRDGYVYIGRENKTYKLTKSPWANPFKLSNYKDNPQQCLTDCKELFEARLTTFKGHMHWRSLLHQLKGKTLVCWCKNKGNELCHGDVLIELIAKYCDSTEENHAEKKKYVRVVHRASMYSTHCGLLNGEKKIDARKNMLRSENWDEVTCTLCLKKKDSKHKPSPMKVNPNHQGGTL